jgi:hypothetical protein
MKSSMKVQPQYLVQTVVKKELPAPPEGDSWHNPEGVVVERIPDGMRLMTWKELLADKKMKSVYTYDDEDALNDGYAGTSRNMTYFTDAPYPLWERPQFLGDVLDGSKFYGGLLREGKKAIILAETFSSRKCQIVSLEGFSIHNSYGNGFLSGIRDFMKVYEFDSLLELAKWTEEKE